jgi:hypothetical protein
MRHRIVFVVLAALLIAATPAFSDELQDWEFNVNGTDYYPAAGDTFASVPGLSSGGFNSTTGLGTFTLTFDPGVAGSYSIGAWFFDPVAVPFYNEYGAANGSAASGESWQIDVPDYDSDSNHTGDIISNLEAGTLNNTNEIPGTSDNYLSECPTGVQTASSCNDAVSMALGFNFTLTSDQEEVITLSLSATNPGGFTLEDIHPVDGNNSSAAEVFYSGSAVTQASCVGPNCGPPPPIPEPASWSLVATAIAFVTIGMRRRLAKR